MIFARSLLPALALTMAACMAPPPPRAPGLPQPGAYPQQPAAPAPGNHQPSSRDEYRSGYDIGGRDASYGYPGDPRRAYERFGSGLEPPFQDGYADGYAHRTPKY